MYILIIDELILFFDSDFITLLLPVRNAIDDTLSLSWISFEIITIAKLDTFHPHQREHSTGGFVSATTIFTCGDKPFSQSLESTARWNVESDAFR